MVAKAFIRASEDRINGSKQKLALFKSKLASMYILVKREQEQFEEQDAQRPSHLRTFVNDGGRLPLETYPSRTGNSIYQHFKGKIQPDVIKFISIRNQVSTFVDCQENVCVLHSLICFLPRHSWSTVGQTAPIFKSNKNGRAKI